jgi:Regulator of ribonuclease activity B
MSWFFLLLLAALGLIVVRIYFKLSAVRKSRQETWDEQVIARLRTQGYAPFNDYQVDFFLALPNETAAAGARARLEPEFSVDVRPLENDPELHLSLHASKSMRLVVPDVQEISRRLTTLATELGGRYDGWAA